MAGWHKRMGNSNLRFTFDLYTDVNILTLQLNIIVQDIFIEVEIFHLIVLFYWILGVIHYRVKHLFQNIMATW